MNRKYVYLLQKLSNNKSNKITIPELGLETTIDDEMMAALKIGSLFNKVEKLEKYEAKKLNKEKVLKAYEIHKEMNKEKLNYICFSGKNALEAYKLFCNKYAKAIINNDLFKVIKTKNNVYVPIKPESIKRGDLEALSTSDVDINTSGLRETRSYIYGVDADYNLSIAAPMITFINEIGFFIDEYILGEALYFIEIIDPNIKELLSVNLNTKFVLSLASYLYDYSLYLYSYSDITKDDQYKTIVDIVNDFDFKIIKDLDYIFVKEFLYEK